MADNKSLPLTMLPDELSMPDLAPGLGMVAATANLPKQTGKAMRAPELTGSSILAAREQLMRSLMNGSVGQWRGLVATALLCDAWADAPTLRVVDYDSHGSQFVRTALEATGRPSIHLCVLGHGKDACVLGMLDGELLIVPPARTQTLDKALPARVTWFDRKSGLFSDPCPYLNQRDRHLLAARLEQLKEASSYVRSFAADVAAIDGKVSDSALSGKDQEAWQHRMKIVLGLLPEDAFEGMDAEALPYVTGGLQSPVLHRFGKLEPVLSGESVQVEYRWQGQAFARTNSQIGLEQAGDGVPKVLATAVTRLEHHSRQFARALAERLDHYMAGCDARFLMSAKEALTQWRDQAQKTAREPMEAMALVWPWNNADPSVRLLLRERLGDALSAAAAEPFSDRLTILPDGDLGDEALNLGCTLALPDGEAVILPPLSEKLTSWLAQQPAEVQVMPTDSLRIMPLEEGVQISMTLTGENGSVHVTRTFSEEEQLQLAPEETPTIALWPAVPVENGRWRSYYLDVRGHIEALVWQNNQWVSVVADSTDGLGPCHLLQMNTMPRALLIKRDGLVLGACLAQAPVCHPGMKGAAVAALDLGATGVSMAVMAGGQVTEVNMPTLLRMLLCGGELDLENELLPVWPMGPVTPSAVQLLREDGDEPFMDGRLCPAEALHVLAAMPDPPDTDLLWRVDDRAAAARRLMLRQSMLMTSFHAVMCGAQSISWRISLPGAISEESRNRLMDEARDAAAWVADETGLPQTPGTQCEGMRSLLSGGMFLRDSGIIRSGMIALDVGSSSAGMAIWLRGMNKPAAEWHLPLGVSTMLMTTLEERPHLLENDFADMPDAASLPFVTDDSRYLPAFSRRRLLIDELFGQRLMQTSQHMNMRIMMGCETSAHALLLLGWAELMTLCGASLEKIQRNTMLNDYLPMELALCLCGRGSEVLLQLDEPTRQGMMRFIRLVMNPNHRVRNIQLTTSGYPRRETTLGLCQLPVLPEKELPLPAPMPEACPILHMVAWFFQQFRFCYPVSCELLFPGMLDARGMFSHEAQQRILQAGDRAVGSDEERFVFCIEYVRAAYAAAALAAEEAAEAERLAAEQAAQDETAANAADVPADDYAYPDLETDDAADGSADKSNPDIPDAE